MEVTDEAIERHRHIVERAARRHWSRVKNRTFLEYNDLLQAGYIGLIQGIERFDPGMGYAEYTFIWPTVYLSIQKEITENGHTLKVGREFKSLASKINASLIQDVQTLAATFGITEKEVRTVQRYLAIGYVSMDHAVDENGEIFSLHEKIGTVDKYNHEDDFDAWAVIDKYCISELDRAIVRLRGRGYTNMEIAQMVENVPNSRGKHSTEVKQINETFRRLRKRIRRGEQDERAAAASAKTKN